MYVLCKRLAPTKAGMIRNHVDQIAVATTPIRVIVPASRRIKVSLCMIPPSPVGVDPEDYECSGSSDVW